MPKDIIRIGEVLHLDACMGTFKLKVYNQGNRKKTSIVKRGLSVILPYTKVSGEN
jgi:hypothetical protein